MNLTVFLAQLLGWSVAISGLLKYIAPSLIDWDTLPALRLQVIALSVVSLPVIFYGLVIWSRPKA